MKGFDTGKLQDYINAAWKENIIPELSEYIRIKNISPIFDRDWEKNGKIEQAVNLAKEWCLSLNLKGATVSVEKLPGRTPLLFIEVDGSDPQSDRTILLYGHLDKQPEMTGWDPDKDPWKPVIVEERLYGRGAADDGYAVFTALTAIKALQELGRPHSRCVLVIESCEESGSFDLPAYIENLGERIGNPDLIICLDSGCGNYEQLWLTTSLRGTVMADLKTSLLSEGVHSGNAGGVVASSFRVMRQVLDRLEDAKTGKILVEGAETEIPEARMEQAQKAADVLGPDFPSAFPLLEGVDAVHDNAFDLILSRTWRPSLSYIGIDGFPELNRAGNVLRPSSALRLSLRVPPLVNSKALAESIKRFLEENPPYNAHVSYTVQHTTDGWNCPEFSPWLERSLTSASERYFGRKPVFMGEGGSIPFMTMLAERFPDSQFMVTGVLGPRANAHGPNEFLHLNAVKKLNACLAQIIADHFANL